MYKAIIFDLDNTLLDYNSSELLSMKNTINAHGFLERETFIWDDFWREFGAINMVYWNERNKRKINVHQVLEYSFRDTFLKMKEEHMISKSMAETYWHEFCNICHLEEGAADILNHLHGSYKLGVITNGIGEAQRSRLLKGEVDHFFDSLIISDEVECWKPDKVIFEKALDDLGLETKEVLFIGDSLTDDYQGSLSAGIDFCYYNKHNQSLDEAIKPKFMIRELAEIKNIILL